ncbi:hypothetical protein PMY56_00685 [Clostridium tertium]|jgi:hypothetical protein|uniref:Uncharacterized protein n=1 Tax=Clostridium tertium TaxID=1559 RepID=A0A9X4B4H8_9CLOT|nr:MULTISPECIES: hypothetical protein [Clostridium]EEH99071.1 hypothetical protein CSBG_02697 [Clostridium sp. 7_2_43FAA]MBP1867797.1 hypothetical protein [Clostridium tertium]MBS5307961.1 hypothetical protein [Clostridium sp.]MBS5885866.1 hypothetical protein [Clostridium sp.]MBS6502361.1 hypothetical protein [Clostridium sp.]
MAKYKVGDELIEITDPSEEKVKLRELTQLTTDGDYAQISWGLKIIKVEYEKPYVTLTYRNVDGEINKVFAECRDIENFDQEKVLEKALLKAFTNEIINISVVKNSGHCKR